MTEKTLRPDRMARMAELRTLNPETILLETKNLIRKACNSFSKAIENLMYFEISKCWREFPGYEHGTGKKFADFLYNKLDGFKLGTYRHWQRLYLDYSPEIYDRFGHFKLTKIHNTTDPDSVLRKLNALYGTDTEIETDDIDVVCSEFAKPKKITTTLDGRFENERQEAGHPERENMTIRIMKNLMKVNEFAQMPETNRKSIVEVVKTMIKTT